MFRTWISCCVLAGRAVQTVPTSNLRPACTAAAISPPAENTASSRCGES
jgi:hypothetical protein